MTSLASAAPNETAIMETREAAPAHFLTKIESFSLLEKYGIDKYESGDFEAGGCKWKLIIYPRGKKEPGSEGYVSVYLAIADTCPTTLPANWEVNAVFSICLLNQNYGNYWNAIGRTRRFHAFKTEWGYSKFISKKDLSDLSNGYLIDDKCVFGAEVFVNKNKAVAECLSLKNVTVTPFKREFKIPNFSTLKNTWTSDEFTVGGCQWKISVYPNGVGEATRRCLSIFLHYVHSKKNMPYERVRASFTLSIKKQKGSRSHWFSTSQNAFGWDSFIQLASLKNPNGGYIVNDCCLVEIELTVEAIASGSPSSITSSA